MFFDISYALTEARPKRGIDCQYPITVSIAFLFRCHWWVIASRFASVLISRSNEFWFGCNEVKFLKINYVRQELFIFSEGVLCKIQFSPDNGKEDLHYLHFASTKGSEGICIYKMNKKGLCINVSSGIVSWEDSPTLFQGQFALKPRLIKMTQGFSF